MRVSQVHAKPQKQIISIYIRVSKKKKEKRKKKSKLYSPNLVIFYQEAENIPMKCLD